MSDARRIAHPVGTMLSCPLNRPLPCAVDRRQRRNTGWSSLCTLGGRRSRYVTACARRPTGGDTSGRGRLGHRFVAREKQSSRHCNASSV